MRSWSVFLLLMVLWGSGAAQTLPPEQTVRPAKWDVAHGVVFFGIGVQSHAHPPIRAYNFDNSQRGADLDIVKDFPAAEQVIVLDVAAGQNESSVLSVVLNYGHKVLRHVLLTYDGNGTLRSVWDTEPYLIEAVTTDDEGAVFAFGDKLLGQDGSASYPLITQFDSAGTVVRRFLSSNMFSDGAESIGSGFGPDHAEPVVMYRDHRLYVYAAASNEVLTCDVDGTFIRKVRVEDIKEKVAHEKKTSVGVMRAEFMDDNHVVLDLYDYIPSSHTEIMPPKAYLVNLTTKSYRKIELPNLSELHPSGKGLGLILATTADGRAFFQQYAIPVN